MALKINVAIQVSDSSKTAYKDPSGFEGVTLYCVDGDLEKIEAAVNTVASALVKVAHAKYIAIIEEKKEE